MRDKEKRGRGAGDTRGGAAGRRGHDHDWRTKRKRGREGKRRKGKARDKYATANTGGGVEGAWRGRGAGDATKSPRLRTDTASDTSFYC